MTDKDELIELCKIAQHLGGPQNLSAVGIGRYLRLCSPEAVLAMFAENETLRHGIKGDYDLDAWLDWTEEATALRDKVEHLECMTENHKIDARIYRADFEACAAVLPCSLYMDPPDGGDVSVPEQLGRMAKDAERYRWLNRQRRSVWRELGAAPRNRTGELIDAAMSKETHELPGTLSEWAAADFNVKQMSKEG